MFARFCKVVDSGEPLNEEFPVKYDSVKATWLRSQVVKLGDGLAVTFSDISEAKATQERYVYRHEWRMGDLLMWDNTGSMHRVRPYEASCGRELHRFTLNGEEPITAA